MPSIAITVPYGVVPGQMMKASVPDGRTFLVPVPEGAKPGMTLMVTVPEAKAPSAGAPAESSNAPLKSDDLKVEIPEQGTTMVEGVNPADLVPCCGLFCAIFSAYPKFPACIGAHSKMALVCVEAEVLCCKTGSKTSTPLPRRIQPNSLPRTVNDGSICMCLKQELEIIKPTTCVKGFVQLCCMDLRCALPCDDEVPCILAVAYITCVKNYKPVCQFGENLTSDDAKKGQAPTAEMMAR